MGASKVARDITERKRAEEEAEMANRTPLNAVLGWANILRRGNLKAEQLRQGLDTIERNARVQAQLIEDLLDMSRIISGKIRLDMQVRISILAKFACSLLTSRPQRAPPVTKMVKSCSRPASLA
jgi:signal transduction histidine kinase